MPACVPLSARAASQLWVLQCTEQLPVVVFMKRSSLEDGLVPSNEANLIPRQYNGENISPAISGECFQGCNVEIAFIVEFSLRAKEIEVEFFHFS